MAGGVTVPYHNLLSCTILYQTILYGWGWFGGPLLKVADNGGTMVYKDLELGGPYEGTIGSTLEFGCFYKLGVHFLVVLII